MDGAGNRHAWRQLVEVVRLPCSVRDGLPSGMATLQTTWIRVTILLTVLPIHATMVASTVIFGLEGLTA